MTADERPIVRLSADHNVKSFDCGEPQMNRWLLERARSNYKRGASTTHVIVDDDNDVIAYYALSMASVATTDVPEANRRGMPTETPAILLGRIAVDTRHKGQGLGAQMIKDAIARSLRLRNEVGVAVMIVHALNDQLRDYYRGIGFVEYPEDSLTFYLPLPRSS